MFAVHMLTTHHWIPAPSCFFFSLSGIWCMSLERNTTHSFPPFYANARWSTCTVWCGGDIRQIPRKKTRKKPAFSFIFVVGISFSKEITYFFAEIGGEFLTMFQSRERILLTNTNMVTCLVLGELFGCRRRRRERAIRPPMYTSYAYSHFPHSYAEYEISLWLAFASRISGAWLWWNFSQRALSLTL